MNSVETNKGGVYFLYGYEGTEKTFIWKTLAAGIRRRGDIVINMASNSIASLLMSGGRTAHSRFHIPINVDDNSHCFISAQSDTEALLKRCKLIIWDEAPMVNKLCFEALDCSLKDILCKNRYDRCEQAFRNMIMAIGGDFRLTVGAPPEDVIEIRKFAEWISKVGDGELGEPNDGEVSINLPDEIVVDVSDDPVTSIIDFSYPKILDNINDPSYFQEKEIHDPTTEVVDNINNHHLLEKFPVRKGYT
nr:ATP-dependent DNA helicase PIF1-like [Tanacetum cinerariifolium]